MIFSNMNGDVKLMKITEHQKLKYVRNFGEHSGDQGNMQLNFWEQGNLTRVNLREHLN